MAAENLALFRKFPKLESRLERCRFVTDATPVETLPLAGLPEPGLLVKRDERCCPLYGGNKPRKLEFIIGRALARGSRRLVTSGGLGTNHGLATTILGRSVGLKTTLVLVPQPMTPAVRRSLELNEALGARVVLASGVRTAVAQTARALCLSQLHGERPHLIWPGGSTSLGNLGFVSAGLELAEQIAEGELPKPAEIYLPVGTGGTIAGLVAGLKLANLDIRVHGVLVTDIMPPTPRALARAANSALALLHRLEARIETPALSAEDFPLDSSELGEGYGAVTPAATAAQSAASEVGLSLETTYTAKCMAALLARSRRGELPSGPVLFWNTYNARTVDPESH